MVTNGPPRPGSSATKCPNGYRLTGTWDFSSGISHASWVAALAPVRNPDGSDTEEMRIFLIHKSEVQVIDEWFVGGLRGTASLSFKTQDLFVPAERSYGQYEPSREPGPLYVIHTTPMFASGFATVALGVARTALDYATDLAKRKTQQGDNNVLSVDTTTQRLIGQSEANWHSARAFLDEAVNQMWKSVIRNHRLATHDRIKVRLAGTHAIRTSAGHRRHRLYPMRIVCHIRYDYDSTMFPRLPRHQTADPRATKPLRHRWSVLFGHRTQRHLLVLATYDLPIVLGKSTGLGTLRIDHPLP